MVPQMPPVCPLGERDGKPCAIGVHHIRERRTGPMFPLTVAVCRVHRYVFTVYPWTHVPYGRWAIAPTSPAGQAIRSEEPKEAWGTTVFQAAIDAEAEEPWSRGPTKQEEQREAARKHLKQAPIPRKERRPDRHAWSTQERILALVLCVLGLAPALSSDDRQRMATTLVVPTLTLIEGAAQIAKTPGYLSRGHAIRAVLDCIALEHAPRRLLAAGYLAGVWGRPLAWEATTGTLRDLAPFQRSGTDPP
jgi:hypothetical protein